MKWEQAVAVLSQRLSLHLKNLGNRTNFWVNLSSSGRQVSFFSRIACQRVNVAIRRCGCWRAKTFAGLYHGYYWVACFICMLSSWETDSRTAWLVCVDKQIVGTRKWRHCSCLKWSMILSTFASILMDMIHSNRRSVHAVRPHRNQANNHTFLFNSFQAKETLC